MDDLLPYLKLESPDGQSQRLIMTETRYTIGRLPDLNDIPLLEDEGIITRVHHCILERGAEGWSVTDKSTNGTILEREGQAFQLAEQNGRKALMTSEDVIVIHHWRLTFVDPSRTKPIASPGQASSLGATTATQSSWSFKVSQEKLFKVENGTRHSVRVRPQVRKMLKHLVEKNLANAHVPVLCTREELIGIILGEKDFGSHEQDLDKLAMEIRKVLKQTADSKQWLETVTGSGYILRIDGEP
ncbi:MAG: hypothetical protein VKL42_08440 [Snowella sp.]|nr:hypothetical protein [Snowella sp.]